MFWLTCNPNIPWDVVEAHPEIIWNWSDLSKNHNLTIEIIKKYHDKPWDWFQISKNPAITFEMVMQNFGIGWDWHGLAQNPNLTWENIDSIRFIHWCWDDVLQNQFCHHPYFKSEHHKKKLVKNFMENCFQELIEKSCTPARKLNWDEEFLEDCQNDFYIGARAYYIEECERYNRIGVRQERRVRRLPHSSLNA
jgi:hypothetical protein